MPELSSPALSAQVTRSPNIDQNAVVSLVQMNEPLAWIHRCGEAEGVGASTRKAS